MPKVIIDPGHGGADPGAVYNERKEAEDNLNLALDLGAILQDAGIDVVYTRTGDITQTPFEKATIGNQSDADLFISLHRNSNPNPNQYSGVETLVYDDAGKKAELARRINANLEKEDSIRVSKRIEPVVYQWNRNQFIPLKTQE